MGLDSREVLKVLENTFSQVIVRFSGSITTFLITLLIVSFMGVGSLGSFVKITAFVTLFYLLIDFGLNTVYLRDHYHKTEVFFGNLLYLRLLLSTAVFILITIIIWLIPTGLTQGFTLVDKTGVMVYALTLFTEGILVSFSGLTQKKLLQKMLILPSIISSLSVLAIVSYGVIYTNIILILLAFPFGEILQILLLFIYVRKKILFSIYPSSFYSFSKTTLIASAPFAVMLFLNVLYFRIDTLILSFYKSNLDVGAYGFAYKIFEFLLVAPTFLSASIFPILIAHKENKQEFQKRIIWYGGLLLSVSLITGFFVFILSPLIVFIRAELSSAILPLRILTLSLPFFFLTSLMQWVLLIHGKVKALISIYFIMMVINIVLNLYYIPQFSFVAASIITVLTEGLVFFCMMFTFGIWRVKKS